MKPAIVIVTYNRPAALTRLLESVAAANYDQENITLVISIDKADIEPEIIDIANRFEWTHGTKTIRTFPQRQGLRKHVLQCGDLSEEYDAVIVLEDDLMVAPDFYRYTQSALSFYSDCPEVTGIALYSHEWNGYANCFFTPIADGYDTYLGQFSISWGQCWTRKWWLNFRTWYEKQPDPLGFNTAIPPMINDWSRQSWGRYFANYIAEKRLYYVIPRISMSTNFSEAGQHAEIEDSDHQVRLLQGTVSNYRFAPVKTAARYDIFFENEQLSSSFESQIRSEGIIIDLAGTGRQAPSCRYILTRLLLPYKTVCSFGMKLRPVDMNILYHIPGNDIFLYDTRCPSRLKKHFNIRAFRYELRGLSARSIIRYSVFLVADKLQRILRHR